MDAILKTQKGLTLTWDVFKSYLMVEIEMQEKGLTLTWDVFKWNLTMRTPKSNTD